MSPFPERFFKFGYEPQNKKVNTYFQLNYLNAITFALEDDHIEKLMDSQFGKLFQAGNKIASSVRFLHYLLSRQLVTSKKKEIWCLFSGQPIRFSMREFVIATGLDCSSLPSTSEGDDDEIKSYTKELFGSEKNATPLWIANTLLGRPYKEKDTRFKLACLLLVDEIVCPTSKNTKINGDHILMVRDVDDFLSYPWGRKSFDITMESIKTRTATLSNLCQPTCAIQSFLHALQMVVLACVPNLLSKDVKGKKPSLADDDEDDDDLPLIRPVVVKHILDDEDSVLDEEIMDDDEEDSKVEKLLSAIEDGTAFTNKSFVGGVKASEHSKLPKHPSSSTSRKSASDGDDDSGVSAFLEKLLAGNSSILNAVNTLSSDFRMIRRDVKSAVNELAALRTEFTKFKKTNRSTDTLPATTSNKVQRKEQQKDNQGTYEGNEENKGNEKGLDNAAAQEGENQVNEPKTGHGVDGSQVEVEKEFTFTDEATKATNTIYQETEDNAGVQDPIVEPANTKETEDNAGVQDPIVEPANTKETEDNADVEHPISEPANTKEIEDYADVQDPISEPANTKETEDIAAVQDPIPEPRKVTGDHDDSSVSIFVSDKEQVLLKPIVDDPPAFSLGLTQEEKNREESQLREQEDKRKTDVGDSSKCPPPTQKTDKSAELSSFFHRPTSEQVSFLEAKIKETSLFPSWYGIRLPSNIFNQIMSCNKPCMNAIVASIRDELWATREAHPINYDFVEFGLIVEIFRLHDQFLSNSKKAKITLPKGTISYIKNRFPWYTVVGRLYCPFQIDGRLWIGLCIDLEAHDIAVFNCNPTIKEMKLKTLIVPLAESLPHFIRRVAYNSEMKNDTLDAFNISIAKPVFQSANQGHSAILTLMLLQLHSENMPVDTVIEDDLVRDAALTYAFDLLCKVEQPISSAPATDP
ncbi:uncharacterized protein LOC112087770 [Eutrema salsugineum]|uniref:uncharacterized protein LOC112087770 n=1 Tax=Eutrema salsugineum TaxID=72664 RepID=UPI000CED7257|nr:uncharacterized protein LOC112087770 [Eutrema salsugineum]